MSKDKIPEYAVVFTYSFSSDAAVHLFDTEAEAVEFLKTSFNEEVRIDKEDGWDVETVISNDGDYAKIICHFDDHDDITEFHLATVIKGGKKHG